MNNRLDNIIKQLVKVTKGEVIFTGSITEFLIGKTRKARDLDILVSEDEIEHLKVFGDIVFFKENPMFKGKGRCHITNEVVPIDIFIGKDCEWEIIKFKGIPVKVQTLDYQIKYLSNIVKNTTNESYKKKFLGRIIKLKNLKDG